MGTIKSAYELAMERAKNIKIDKSELKRKENEKKGKEAASSFINKPKFNFDSWINELENEEKKDCIKGAMWVFIKNISLPKTTSDVDKLVKIKEGIIILTGKEDELKDVFTQLTAIFQQYIENCKTLLEQCKTEFAPKLQQKAMQIAQQTGQLTPIEPETDRDFIEYHKGQQDQLDKHYKEALEQITATLEKLI